MGRTPRPNVVKELRGTRPSRMNETEVPVLPAPVVAPDWLSDKAREHFDELAAKIAPGAVAPVDAHALGMLAEALTDYLAARDVVDREPFTLDEHGTPRRHPAHIVREAAAGRVLSWARECGLTPAARARMARVGVAEREPDPGERLLTRPLSGGA